MPLDSGVDRPVVLLVEDQGEQYELYSALLVPAGYQVVGVSDGRQAVEYAARLLPDLVVMDLGLPGIDGLQATRSLRSEARTRRIPIVVLTGFVQPAYEDLAFDAGCDAFLSKPCPAEQLLQVIERLMNGRATVLVVEDDDDVRSALGLALVEEGFRVAGARNGQEALDYLHTHGRPRLILLDLMMPVMTGWQFRDAQRSEPGLATIPVIVLSADGNVKTKAASLDVSAVLSKPIDLHVLLNAITTIESRR
jgi:CheY-like chemotaxis protein